MVKFRFFLFVLFFFTNLIFSKENFYIGDTGWDFGEVLKGTVLDHNLLIGNRGKKEIKVFLRSGCPCIKLLENKVKLKEGKEKNIKIILNTENEKGVFHKNIYIHVPDSDFGVVSYPVEGFVYEKVKILLFYEPGCKGCEKIEEKINKISKKYELILEKYRIDKKENFEKLLELESKLEKRVSGFPVLCVNGRFYTGKNIDRFLNGLEKGVLIKEFKEKEWKWSFFPFIGAALLDGINPCAFSVIIIMITYLSLFGRNKNFILISGILYTFGVFITYFLFGLGLLRFLKELSSVEILRRILFLVFGILSFFLMV
ncbi:MAG: hypothetical protein DRI36_03365, partial [Caldiserica bacterium]